MAGELTEVEIQEILKDGYIGRIGCTDGAKVYILPVNYLYEENSILCYSPENHKIKMMRKHPNVCFEVDRIAKSFNWKCVVINGVFEEITNPQELKEIRPLYTEYMLGKRVSLTALPDNDTKQAAATQPSRDYIFYRIHFNK